MTVKEIIKKYLMDNGFDGLRSDSCGCKIDDLMPCDDMGYSDCEPGYINKPCPYHENITDCACCPEGWDYCISVQQKGENDEKKIM